MKEFIIEENEAGQRFDKYLAKLLKEAPKSLFKRTHPVTATFCWSRIIYSTLPVDTPIPYSETGIYTDTNHTGVALYRQAS